MKLFIKKIFLFCLPVIVVYGLVVAVVFLTNGRQCKELPIGSDTRTIILGDSHTECAFNDSLLPGVRNLSKSSEGYFYNYAKLRYLLDKYPDIETVILGYSYHNMAEYIEEFIYGNQSSVIICRYFPLLHMSDKCKLLMKNPDIVGDKQVLLTGIKNFYDCEQYSTLSFLGEFLNVETEKTLNIKNVKERISSQYYRSGIETGFAGFNIEYLNKIIELCGDKHKRLVLISTPLNELYRKEVPEKFISKYREMTRLYEGKVEVINMDDLVKLEDKHYLPDGDHVTVEGAELTTLALKSKVLSLY